MAIYEDERFIRESLESLLNQTFQDFEILIINDCGKDETLSIVKSYGDPRINIIENPQNIGLTKSLNIGLKTISSKYVARMDADDVSVPERLKVQYDFLEAHPQVGVCGSWHKDIDTGYIYRLPDHHDHIRIGLLKGNVFNHSSCMLRTSVLHDHAVNYNEYFQCSQDYELWVRLSRITLLRNIQQPLILSRKHKQQISAKRKHEQFQYSALVILEQLEKVYPLFCSDEEKFDFAKYWFRNPYPLELKKIRHFSCYLKRLKEQNAISKIYPKREFNDLLFSKWKVHLNTSLRKQPSLFVWFVFSPNYMRLSLLNQLKLVAIAIKNIWKMKRPPSRL